MEPTTHNPGTSYQWPGFLFGSSLDTKQTSKAEKEVKPIQPHLKTSFHSRPLISWWAYKI
jgi:hypothetical protein